MNQHVQKVSGEVGSPSVWKRHKETLSAVVATELTSILSFGSESP